MGPRVASLPRISEPGATGRGREGKHAVFGIAVRRGARRSAVGRAGGAGAGPSQARGRRARRRRDLRRRARPGRRHLQEARPRARHFLHAGRRRDDPGRHLQRAQIGVAIGFLGTIGAYRQGRAGPRHRLDLHRRQPVVLVRPRRLADQVAEGRRRQDRGLFDQRLLDPHLGAGAEEIHRRRFQADPDRRRARRPTPR